MSQKYSLDFLDTINIFDNISSCNLSIKLFNNGDEIKTIGVNPTFTNNHYNNFDWWSPGLDGKQRTTDIQKINQEGVVVVTPMISSFEECMSVKIYDNGFEDTVKIFFYMDKCYDPITLTVKPNRTLDRTELYYDTFSSLETEEERNNCIDFLIELFTAYREQSLTYVYVRAFNFSSESDFCKMCWLDLSDNTFVDMEANTKAFHYSEYKFDILSKNKFQNEKLDYVGNVKPEDYKSPSIDKYGEIDISRYFGEKCLQKRGFGQDFGFFSEDVKPLVNEHSRTFVIHSYESTEMVERMNKLKLLKATVIQGSMNICDSERSFNPLFLDTIKCITITPIPLDYWEKALSFIQEICSSPRRKLSIITLLGGVYTRSMIKSLVFFCNKWDITLIGPGDIEIYYPGYFSLGRIVLSNPTQLGHVGVITRDTNTLQMVCEQVQKYTHGVYQGISLGDFGSASNCIDHGLRLSNNQQVHMLIIVEPFLDEKKSNVHQTLLILEHETLCDIISQDLITVPTIAWFSDVERNKKLMDAGAFVPPSIDKIGDFIQQMYTSIRKTMFQESNKSMVDLEQHLRKLGITDEEVDDEGNYTIGGELRRRAGFDV